jgi:hypothetical protein
LKINDLEWGSEQDLRICTAELGNRLHVPGVRLVCMDCAFTCRRFVVEDLWSDGVEDLWSDGTGTLLRVLNPPLFFRRSTEARTPQKDRDRDRRQRELTFDPRQTLVSPSDSPGVCRREEFVIV